MVSGRQMELRVPCRALYCAELQMGPTPAISSGLHLLLVVRLRVLPPSGLGVARCLWVLLLGGSSSKGSPGGEERGERISPTRCVSSMLICHPLNLYCSSTGSISHIAGPLVLLRLRSALFLQTTTEKQTGTSITTLKTPVVTLDQIPTSSSPSLITPLLHLHLNR